MAKVSNEVQLIVALWKKKLDKRRVVLAKEMVSEEAGRLPNKELDGIDFAENQLAKIIYNLEAGQFGAL